LKFIQKKDGSCDLIFAEEEIAIINKHKKLIFDPKFFKHFVNNLAKITFQFQDNFDEKTKDLQSYGDEEIFTDAPKDKL